MVFAFEQIIFYFLLFAIPFQVRKILWYQNWYFNEWQSFSLYGTDLLLIILFVFWFLRSRELKLKIQKLDFLLILFLVVAGISVKNGQSLALGIFQWIKLLEFVVFYFYIKYYAKNRFDVFYSFLAIFAGGVFQAILAIGQFLKQSNLGFSLLGETALNPNLNGVAVFLTENGERVMRSYGTTPHPNILAAYLFLAIFSFYAWYFYNKQSLSRNLEIVLLICYGVTVFGLFTTFSRTILLLFALGFILRGLFIVFNKVVKRKFSHSEPLKKKLINIFLITIIAGSIFGALYHDEVKSRITISSEDEAVSLRIFYNKESLKSGVNLFGLGLGNFVNWFMAND